MNSEQMLSDLKGIIYRTKNILKEIDIQYYSLDNSKNKIEKDYSTKQINNLKEKLNEGYKQINALVGELNILRPLNPDKKVSSKEIDSTKKEVVLYKKNNSLFVDKDTRNYLKEINSSDLEKGTIKRIKLGEGKSKVSIKEENISIQTPYSILANRVFSKFSKSLSEKNDLRNLERELIKAHMPYTPSGYFSTIMFSCLIVFICSVVLSVFFLFFYLGAEFPIIHAATNSPIERLPQVIWMIVIFPVITFLLMYFYPSLEKKSAESAIDMELPFATIHMAAIAGSMIDPSKIFSIMISTKEYPHLEKEFTKLMNEINVYGYDLVSALRSIAFNSPSKRFSELFNGLATTINSGGSLPDFFNKRAESLLFEYKLEKEKSNKAAETFMDIYISVVIAAPMILMLLLMMMKISGLGLNMSTSMITLIMVLSVAMVNVVFLVFLHLKK